MQTRSLASTPPTPNAVAGIGTPRGISVSNGGHSPRSIDVQFRATEPTCGAADYRRADLLDQFQRIRVAYEILFDQYEAIDDSPESLVGVTDLTDAMAVLHESWRTAVKLWNTAGLADPAPQLTRPHFRNLPPGWSENPAYQEHVSSGLTRVGREARRDAKWSVLPSLGGSPRHLREEGQTAHAAAGDSRTAWRVDEVPAWLGPTCEADATAAAAAAEIPPLLLPPSCEVSPGIELVTETVWMIEPKSLLQTPGEDS